MTVFRNVLACGALAMASVLATAPASAAFTLNNTNGGDGYVTVDSSGFDLFGSDNESGDNLTGYTDIAAKTQSYKATYTYTTADFTGSFYDPAGYYINGALKRLSPFDSGLPSSSSGVVRFRVHTGDNYGFYVASDGYFGRANIAAAITSDVPEVSSWIMLVAGFGIVGTVLRRRGSVAQASAA